jgi:tetratricopeptide (TPR) repeat protein
MKTIRFLSLCLFLATVLTACDSSNESKADKFYNQGNIEEAIKYYQLAIEEDANDACIDKLAILYANMRQSEKAKEWYIKSFEKGNETAAEILANNALRDGQYDEVVIYAKAAADKGNERAIYAIGSAYLKMKAYDNAIQYLSKNDENVYVQDILGQAYYAKGDYVNAEKYWKAGVDNHNSGGLNSYHNLLQLYKEQGRTEDYNKYYGTYE